MTRRHHPVPRVLLLTDAEAVPAGRSLADAVAAAVAAGVDGVVVRERHLGDPARRQVGREVRAAAERTGSHPVLLWAAPVPGPAREHEQQRAPATAWAGVHLRSGDRFPAVARPALVGRSCHTAEDLRRAADEGCDYVTLSPVAASRSKPGHGPALGVDGFRTLLEQAAYLRPDAPRVLALGGVTAGTTHGWLEAGAHGVAVMGAVMASDQPGPVAADLVAQVRP